MRGPGRVALLAVVGLLWSLPAVGQDGIDEVTLLRRASLLEAAGQYPAAESVLVKIVTVRPASAPALLSLDRVLRQQRRLAELPAHIERGLQNEPRSALLNQLLIRTYARLDRPAELEAAAAAWIEAAPGAETAHREVARAWEARGDYQRARLALEAGREQIGRPTALALELGALYATLGQTGRAAEEWDRAVGPDGRAARQVRRLLASLPDGGAAVIPDLVRRLSADQSSDARMAAALEIALSAGLEEVVTGLAQRLAERSTPESQERMLLDLARRADGAGMGRVAYWAYGEIVARGGEAVAPAVRSRYGELALEFSGRPGAAGAAALVAPGDGTSADRRAAAALRIEVMAEQDPEQASQALDAFREAYPQAAELDRLVGMVGAAMLTRGRLSEIEVLVAGVRGPRSDLVRARLALLRGDRDRARAAYLRAAPGLRGAEATRTLSLVSLLPRVADETGVALGHAMADVAAGDPGRALDRLLSAAERVDGAERAAVLDFAVGLADEAALDRDALGLRRMIVADHPRSREAPGALLGLARSLPPEASGEARELLEQLILEYPNSALVPQARGELERLERAARAASPNHGTRR